MYVGGHASHVLGLALSALERCERILAAQPAMPWRELAAQHAQKCRAMLRDIERTVAAAKQKAAQRGGRAPATAAGSSR